MNPRNRQQSLDALISSATEKAKQSGSLVGPEEAQEAPQQTPPDVATEREQPSPKRSQSARKTARAAPADPPAQSPRRTDSAIRAATLVPAALYEQIKTHHGGDGTFGQLITWACQDHPDEIAAEVLDSASAPTRVSRVPRVVGAGKAATRQIAPRFQPEEEAVVAELLDRIKDTAASNDAADPAKVTRTALQVAALRAWTRNNGPDTD